MEGDGGDGRGRRGGGAEQHDGDGGAAFGDEESEM